MLLRSQRIESQATDRSNSSAGHFNGADYVPREPHEPRQILLLQGEYLEAHLAWDVLAANANN